MAINIPRELHKAFFELRPHHTRAGDKVMQFIALTATGETAELAEALHDRNTCYTPAKVTKVLIGFFEHVTMWSSTQHTHMLHNIRVCETLLNDGEPVFEMEGILQPYLGKGELTKIREWFDKANPWELLEAIECRVTLPAYMYTGLDNRGNNQS